MKKIISTALIISMLLGTVSLLSGCKKTVKGGTDAAKLLLANERLDEKLVGSKIDIGLNKITASNTENMVNIPTVYSDGSNSSPKYTWNNFGSHNYTLSQFESFIINIENEAKYVAEDIANMKNNVGVVDKWVKVGYDQHMLRVFENKDVLLVRSTNSEDRHAYFRYTDENANNVYEMYSFMNYDDGSTGDIRTFFIPGERYEFHYINSNGFEDYVIMENTRGYWMCTRYNYHKNEVDEGINFTPLIIKDGLCYATSLSYYNTDELHGVKDRDSNNCSLVDIESGRELISVGYADDGNGKYFNFDLPLSAVVGGFEYLGSNEATNVDGVDISSNISSIKTQKGTFQIPLIFEESSFQLGMGMVSYDFLEETHTGNLVFHSSEPHDSLDSALNDFDAHVEELGLTLAHKTMDLKEAINHAFFFSDGFAESFEWNGYKMTDLENVKAARSVLVEDFNRVMAELDAVKDFEVATIRQKLHSGVDFSELGIIGSGSNIYNSGVISLSGVSAQIKNTDLLESGKSYSLKVALSLCDENGNPLSVNTVPIGMAGQSVEFNGSPITLSVSGEYAVPKNLNHGDYALVVYAATADEGIRVSDMVKLASFSTYNESLNSEAMDITVVTVDENLHVRYVIKNSHNISMIATKDSYTTEEIEHILMIEILKKGAPFSGATLETSNGEDIPNDASLGRGKYRMMCYLATADGLAQSYIYLDLN